MLRRVVLCITGGVVSFLPLDLFCFTVSVSMPTAHLLSNWIGVGPCGWPSSIAAFLIGIAPLALLKPAPVSDSCADDMTASITLLVTSTGALVGGACWSGVFGRVGSSLKNINPPPRKRAFGSLR